MPDTTGSCHCGAVRWTYRGDIAYGNACNCTICRRYGVIWSYGKLDQSVFINAPQGALSQYIWGDKSISFNFCTSCGCVVTWQAVQTEDDGSIEIAVNLRLAEPDAVANIPLRRFDGLHSWKTQPSRDEHVKDLLN